MPLVAETAGRWVELGVSLLVVAAAGYAFRRWPLFVLSLAVGGALVPSLVLSSTAADPVRLWPFVACAVYGYLVGRGVGRPRVVLTTLGALVLAGLPVSVVADVVVRGGFGVLFGLDDWFVLVLVLLLVVVLPWLAGGTCGCAPSCGSPPWSGSPWTSALGSPGRCMTRSGTSGG